MPHDKEDGSTYALCPGMSIHIRSFQIMLTKIDGCRVL